MNGEEGLDSNSAKTISLLFGLQNESIQTGIAAQVGNRGSVPVKEWANQCKIYYHQNTSLFNFGFETLGLLQGLRDKGILTNLSQLQNRFSYEEGFFDPQTLINDGSYEHPKWLEETQVLGFAATTYLRVNSVFTKKLVLDLHVSLYDPNIFSNNKNVYAIKYRGFLNLTLKITPHLNIFLSDAYTFDPVFLFEGQFYDRESRENHPIIDNDINVGVIYKL